MSKQLRNHDGIVKVSRPTGDGHICEVALQAKQVMSRATAAVVEVSLDYSMVQPFVTVWAGFLNHFINHCI